MIKLNQSKDLALEYKKKLLNSNKVYRSPKKRIEEWIDSHPNPSIEKDIMSKIYNDLDNIIISTPAEIQDIVKEYNDSGLINTIIHARTKKLTAFGKEINEVFGYKRFRDGAKAVWLSKKLNIKSCVYCNTQYSLTVNHNGQNKMLFHFDHYYPKSKYPFLSLSFYNLIPCCASCNMSKTATEYHLDDNFHPYVDSLHKVAKYEIEKGNLTRYLLDLNEQEINIKFNLRKEFALDPILEKKLTHYKKEFKLETQYNQFKDVAAEIFLKALYYNSARKLELKNFFKKNKNVHLNKELIDRFIVGNYTEDKHLLNRPLAKFMKDLSEDLNLS